jgi:hypothetical protein
MGGRGATGFAALMVIVTGKATAGVVGAQSRQAADSNARRVFIVEPL